MPSRIRTHGVVALTLLSAADAQGKLYGAEVGPKDVEKYVKR
jgi:hypothetical protein